MSEEQPPPPSSSEPPTELDLPKKSVVDGPAPKGTKALTDAEAEARVSLFFALSVGFLGVGLPALLSLWGNVALIGSQITAELLEQSGGLDPKTYRVALYIATAINIGVVGWGVLRRLGAIGKPHETPWSGLSSLVGLYIMGMVLIPIELVTKLDLPDIFPTVVLLGTLQLAVFVTPFLGFVLLIRGTAAAWRSGLGSDRNRRRVVGLAGTCGAGGLAITAWAVAGLGLGYEVPTDQEDAVIAERFQTAASDGAVEASFALMKGMAHALTGSVGGAPLAPKAGESPRVAPALLPPAASRTARPTRSSSSERQGCADTLASAEPGTLSEVELQRSRLERQGVSRQDAHDITMEAFLDVCYGSKVVPIRPGPYYSTAVKNKKKRFFRRRNRDRGRLRDIIPSPSHEPIPWLAEQRCVERSLGHLTPKEREVFALRYEGNGYSEIAAKLQTTESALRKRMERARTKLRNACPDSVR